MANADQAEDSSAPLDPEAKFKRCQEAGLSFFLAIPVALMLAAMFGLERWYGHISVLLGIIGAVFFSFGLIGRQELAEKEKEDGPKYL